MKKIFKRITVLMMCAMLVLQLAACGSDSKCKEVVEKFETACNENNLEGILDCITPDIATPIKLAVGVTSLIPGIDLSETLTGLLAELMGSADTDVDASALFSTMDLKVTKTEKKSKDRMVYVDITYEVLGTPIKSHGVFRMEEDDKEWYIKSFRFVDGD